MNLKDLLNLPDMHNYMAVACVCVGIFCFESIYCNGRVGEPHGQLSLVTLFGHDDVAINHNSNADNPV